MESCVQENTKTYQFSVLCVTSIFYIMVTSSVNTTDAPTHRRTVTTAIVSQRTIIIHVSSCFRLIGPHLQQGADEKAFY